MRKLKIFISLVFSRFGWDNEYIIISPKLAWEVAGILTEGE